MNVTPFEAYQKYLAIKMHFTAKSYDYFKFGGKVKASKAAFEKRQDKYWFKKISIKFDAEQFEKYLVANFVENDDIWIGDILDDKAKTNYLEWIKRTEALAYNFKQDILHIKESAEFEHVDPRNYFNSLFKCNFGQRPAIVGMAMTKTISLETLIILNILFDFFPKCDKNISDTLIWPEFKKKCLKYQPFIAKKIARDTFKKILVEAFGLAK